MVRMDREPGSSLVEGVPFATAWPAEPGAALTTDTREKLTETVNAAVATGFERTNVQDVGFGFRQLVDVAVRALSPGINDPTTAVHVIGHLSVLLCRLAGRNPGPEHLTDDAGRVRVVVALPELRDLLDMAMNQPRQYGAADPPSRPAPGPAPGTHLVRPDGQEAVGDPKASRPPTHHHRSRPYSPSERQTLLEQAEAINHIQTESLHPGGSENP